MYTFYILFQDKNFLSDIQLIPLTGIIKHNSKYKGFTYGVKDWEIVYTERFQTKYEATEREKQIKAWKTRQLVEALVQNGSAIYIRASRFN